MGPPASPERSLSVGHREFRAGPQIRFQEIHTQSQTEKPPLIK